MKRAGILGLALLLTIALGTAATQAKKKKKVRVAAQVSLTIQYPPPPEPEMSGEVTSAKPKCERNRTIKVTFVPQAGGPETAFGTATSDGDGSWRLPHDVLTPGKWGDYRATATKRKIRKKRKVIVCKSAVSPTFRYPP
jgi:hypothetical protein